MALNGTVRKLLINEADPSIRYHALRDLEGRPESDPRVRSARRQIGREGWAADILSLRRQGAHWDAYYRGGWSLYMPKYTATNWRLLVLSDLGLTRKDPRVAESAQLLMRRWSDPREGVFGEPGSEVCITGNAVRMLTRFGYFEDRRVQRALRWLVEHQKSDGGWHCFPSKKGTLDGWEALAAFAAVPWSLRSAEVQRSIERGAEFYLERELLREGDGTGNPPWERIHYPNHYYYDFLVGLDFLTELGYGNDRRLRKALSRLVRKRRGDGTWELDAQHPDLAPDDPYHPRTPVYPFMLEHVGLPSQWATLRALRVLKRVEEAGGRVPS